MRFWSTVLHVETDAGRVWVKENAPSQAFEAGLVQVVEGIVPGLCAPLVAVDTERGWFATADLGLPLWHDGTPPPPDDWVAVVGRVLRGAARARGPRRRGARRGRPALPGGS